MVRGRLSSRLAGRLAGLLLLASPALYAQGAGQPAPTDNANRTGGALPPPPAPPAAPTPTAETPAPTPAASAGTPSGQPAAAASAATNDGASKPEDSKPAAPKVPMTGYGWTDDAKPAPPAPSPHRRVRPAAHAAGPGVVRPGFEMLADGSSRLFVELSQAVPVDEKRGKRELTYVLKGAHVEKANNYNPLVTVHFNSPVTRARLLPHGKDLWFSVELRADTTPTWKVAPAKDGMQMLQIEFPKGDYLPHAPAKASPAGKPSEPADDNAGG